MGELLNMSTSRNSKVTNNKYRQSEMQLPQNIEAECSVLGSILIDPQAVDLVIDFLNVGDFYRDAHRMIYDAIVSLVARHEPADYITICDVLERSNRLDVVGGASYIATLISGVPTSANIEHYAKIVQETAILRRLIHAAGQIAAMAYESSDAHATMAAAEELLHKINRGRPNSEPEILHSIIRDYGSDLEDLYQKRRKGIVTGVPTHFLGLDRLLGGLQPSDLITLAARPGRGKTSLALNIAQQVAEDATDAGYRVLIFSLEMGKKQLARRLVSMETGIDQTRLRSGDIEDRPIFHNGEAYETEWLAITDALDRLSASKIWIDDTPALSLIEMQSRARRLQAKSGIDLIVVDYLQLMRATTEATPLENRVQEVGMIAAGLKQMARELNVPVIALAQLNRSVESRADKLPQLSDLRESGAIEQDSDVVMFLHDDPTKGIKDKKDGYVVNVIVAKQRNGPVGETPLWFDPRLTRFQNVDPRIVESTTTVAIEGPKDVQRRRTN